MFSNLSTSSVLALIPEVMITVPYIGTIDARPFITASIIFVGLTVLFKVLQMVVIARLKKVSKYTSTDVDDVLIAAVEGVRAWAYTIIALYASLQVFVLPEIVEKGIGGVFYFVVVWQVIEVAAKIIDYGAMRFLEKDEDGDGEVDPNAATASNMVTLMARIVMWSLGVLFVLSNLGIEVTSLLAGLGIGGIAIAFALQGILSDLFASFSIYFDKPFRIGDFVVIGSDSGTVEKIGIKSTRLRTLQGEELVVSNAELTTARVQNFKKMAERRIVTHIGVTYETHQDRLKEIPGIVERIFEDIKGARHDRTHFTTFADFALVFEIVYFIESSDYTKYLKHQQEFNFKLLERFAELGIEFAYPTSLQYTRVIERTQD